MNGDRFVDDRLASLDKGEEIMIDPAKILARLHTREQARRKTQTRLIGAGIFGALAAGALATVLTVQQQPQIRLPTPPVAPSAPKQIELPLEAKNDSPAKPPAPRVVTRPEAVPPRSFKELGSPTASVSVEVYLDPQCPPCATFYTQTIPALIAEYVDTGKAKLLYRDFPLPQHKYAHLAAEYANAAGIIGKYALVSGQIIRTQSMWKDDGNVEAQVAAVLSPDDMQRLHSILDTSAEPDESIARDRAAGADDHVNQTPSIVLVANGKRQKISGVITMPLLRNYLDGFLGRQ